MKFVTSSWWRAKYDLHTGKKEWAHRVEVFSGGTYETNIGRYSNFLCRLYPSTDDLPTRRRRIYLYPDLKR